VSVHLIADIATVSFLLLAQIIVVRQPQAPKEEESVVGEDDDMF